MALDGHQELMLNMGEAGRAGLLLAPVLEAAQADPKGKEVLEVAAGWLGQGNAPRLGAPGKLWSPAGLGCGRRPR